MLNEQGYEIPDNTPVELPSRLRVPQSRVDQIRGYIREEMSRSAAKDQQESFEEADDFNLPDGEDWFSPYEETFEPPSPPESKKDSPRGDAPEGGTESPSDPKPDIVLEARP